ncbi:phosphonate metabolism transcriptional regulator PhnF [Devosia nitrariae]|uniref:Phosphonate metabolism transcriptional regulator PhnF n=1 Tax=Devosia nitrariae TaxID=2071872 RepID=A0ABQ5WDN1_9HYPH|nr:phosphonate metabolism transcriptional regulator PhnF [Devosia nitrariae]GLQ57993.1 phosphonate metabolism transcriptional regulator PhnF [Devosia nitrariae]
MDATHENLAGQIADRIRQDWLGSGTRLPTQQSLALEYGVNRHAIRQALDLLERRGVIESRQGSGSYVRGSVIDYYVNTRTRYNDNVRRLDEASSIELLKLQQMRCDSDLARALALPPDSPTFQIHIRRWTRGEALCLAQHFFSAARYPDLPEHFAGITRISDLLERLGRSDYRRSNTQVTARQATREEAKLLNLAANAPVIVLEGRNVDRAGIPIEISRSTWPANRLRVHV